METIALSQRQTQQNILCSDTLWQTINGRLSGITIFKIPDTIGKDGNLYITSIQTAELCMEKQAKSEITVMKKQKDSLNIKQLETEENLTPSSNVKQKRCFFPVFCIVILCVALFVLMLFVVKSRIKSC